MLSRAFIFLPVVFVTSFAPIKATATTFNSSDVVLLSRASERLIVALSGLCCLWMGYRLFSLKSVDSSTFPPANREQDAPSNDSVFAPQGRLDASLGSIAKIGLSGVAPGIFFSLFGSLILIYVLSTRVDATFNEGGTTITSFGLPKLQAPLKKDQAAPIINAIKLVYNSSTAPPVTQSDRTRLEDASRTLKDFIPELVDLFYGKGAYLSYLSEQEKRKSPDYKPNNDSNYEEIDRLVHGVP